MATYKPGINKDCVVKTESVDQNLDLTVFIEEFKALKKELEELPVKKKDPDKETLDYWNERVCNDGQNRKLLIDDRAIQLYDEIKFIKNARLLPSKYDDEYKQLENYINNL